MRIIFLISVFLLAFVSGSSQTIDASKINDAKARLELLQKQLWQVDLDERSDVTDLGRQSLQKGEFETTKQFEQRQQKLQEKTNEIELQTLRKTGSRRDEIHRKMNEIFRTEFSGEIGMTLGRYDADTQRFTLLTNNGVGIGFIPVALVEAPKFKNDFSCGNISGRLGLLLNADNKAEEFLISAQFSLNGKTFPVVTGAFTQGRAMQMLFGNYDAGTKSSVWETFTRSSDGEDKYELATLQAKPVFFKPFKQNNTDKYLLVANTEPYKIDDDVGSCHACYGLPSIAVFAQNNGYWKVEMALKHGGEIGGYGDPGTPSLVRVGPEQFAVKFSWNNGRAAMAEGVYYWRIDGGFPREILNIYTSQDYDTDYAPNERISFRTTTVFLPTATAEFFDVKVTTVGKKAVKVGLRFVMKPFTKTETYIFSEGKYNLKV
jgi:hypothetical protein